MTPHEIFITFCQDIREYLSKRRSCFTTEICAAIIQQMDRKTKDCPVTTIDGYKQILHNLLLYICCLDIY